MKYRIYFVNFDYYSQEVFDTVDDAIARGIDTAFEFNVSCDDGIKASWGPLRGLTRY